MKIRTRYAPSPTGKMHVGNLRSALYEFLIAKHEGGTFMLRIEDTDQERFVEGATEIIYRTLETAGLKHDEGPDRDGGYGPYVQSERIKTGIYMKYAKELIEKGEAYYCFCDKERLASLKADITVENAELDDMILIKSDGFPTYNFANVVDDHTMDITHVVRGNEYLSSSPKYTRLYEAFGWEPPRYVHLPLVTDENHKKLAKRGGSASFEDLLEQGFVTEAIVNFIALLGWSPEDNREIFTLDELIKEFDYRRISKSPTVFDLVKLRWMNGEYIKAMDFDIFYEKAEPYLKKAITKDLDLRKIAAMVKTRIEVFPDIVEMVDFFEELPEYDAAMYTHKKMKTNSTTSLEVLSEVLPLLEAQEDFSNDALFDVLVKYVGEKGCKNGYVMWPLRTAVSGKQTTPAGATEIMEVLGKKESLERIRKGISLLQSQ